MLLITLRVLARVRRRLLLFFLLLITIAVWVAFGADDQYKFERDPKRLALVVGNSAYTNLAPVESAAADASSVKASLEGLGFEVTPVKNFKNRSEFESGGLEEFRRKISTGDFVVVYFSGHGFAYGPDTYLAPTEIPAKISVKNVADAALSLDSITYLLASLKPGLLMLFIDACRSTGTVDVLNDQDKSVVTKGPGSPTRERATNTNTFIAYATQPGYPSIGYSTPGRLSPFTDALVANISTPGKAFKGLFSRVAVQVIQATNVTQNPGAYDWSKTDPYFKPLDQNLKDEREAWLSALDSGNYQDVELFNYLHSISRHSAAARKWLADNPPWKLSPDFTSAAPSAIDRAWAPKNDSHVAIRRSVLPFAYKREITETSTLKSFSREEIGLVASGTSATQLSTSRAGEKYVTGITSSGTRQRQMLQNSVAYNLSMLDAHDSVVATKDFAVRERPSTSAPIVDRIQFGAELIVKDVIVNAGNNVWVQAVTSNREQPVYVVAEWIPPPPPLELGQSLQEIVVPPRQNSTPDLVEGQPILATLASLKAAGWQISWVSLSAAESTDDSETSLRQARMRNARYVLKQAGIDEKRISSVAGRDDFSSNGVRVRFFGIK